MSLELPVAWLAAYPGTRIFPELRLLTWSPRGQLNRVSAESIAHWMNAIEAEFGTFNRFIDLSLLDEMHLTGADVASLAVERRVSYSGTPVSTVILARTRISRCIATLYAQLMEGSLIEVHVVQTVESASEILKVSADVLSAT